MKIVKVSPIPMSAPVPEEERHRTDLGTKVKSDATLIRVETDNGLTGIGAALGTLPIVAAIVEHELAAECVDEDPMFSERIYEKMYNGSRSRPARERGITRYPIVLGHACYASMAELPGVCCRILPTTKTVGQALSSQNVSNRTTS
jgi:L-alanine-DL-glutamate epimerase-like enolase superfamily enzyme